MSDAIDKLSADTNGNAAIPELRGGKILGRPSGRAPDAVRVGALTPEQETAIRTRAAANPPGPWIECLTEDQAVEAVLHARTDIPALLAEIDRLRDREEDLLEQAGYAQHENESLFDEVSRLQGALDNIAALAKEVGYCAEGDLAAVKEAINAARSPCGALQPHVGLPCERETGHPNLHNAQNEWWDSSVTSAAENGATT